jgi:hypothetical protein
MKFLKMNLTLSTLAALIFGTLYLSPIALADDTTSAVTATTTADAPTTGASTTGAEPQGEKKGFKNWMERRTALKKLKAEDPAKFEAMKAAKKEEFLKNHPKAAERVAEGKPMRPEGMGMRKDMRENIRDHREDVRDHRENVMDRREDRWDAKHNGGKMDKIEDRMDRREDVRDHREDVRDRAENKWDAHHGVDRGKPGKNNNRPAQRARSKY